MDKNINKCKVLGRAISRNPIIAISRMMHIILLVALGINILVLLLMMVLKPAGLINFEESFVRIGLNLILFGCFYSVHRSKRARMMKRFKGCEEIPAFITNVNSITLVRGISSVRYSYEYNGVSYSARESISDFNGDARRLKAEDRIKVLINIDNPCESLISDLCLYR